MRTDLPVWRLPRMKRMRDSLIVRGLNLRTRMAAPGGAAACAIGRRAAAAVRAQQVSQSDTCNRGPHDYGKPTEPNAFSSRNKETARAPRDGARSHVIPTVTPVE